MLRVQNAVKAVFGDEASGSQIVRHSKRLFCCALQEVNSFDRCETLMYQMSQSVTLDFNLPPVPSAILSHAFRRFHKMSRTVTTRAAGFASQHTCVYGVPLVDRL